MGTETLIQFIGLAYAGVTTYLILRKAPLERRAAAVATTGDLLDELTKAGERNVELEGKYRTERDLAYQRGQEINRLKEKSDRDDAEILRQQGLNKTLADNLAGMVESNAALTLKVDGMPTVIAQQSMQILLDKGLKITLRQLLVELGLPLKDQPSEQPEVPLSDLTPDAQKLVDTAEDTEHKTEPKPGE